MRTYNQSWLKYLAACLLVVCVGCGGGDESNEPNGQPDPGSIKQVPLAESPNVTDPGGIIEPAPLPPPTIPEVKLTAEDLATSLVLVGETLADGELSDLAGQTHKLADLYGERLTIVCFWTSGKSQYGQLRAVGLLKDLQTDFAQRYEPQGLRVIGIHQGDAVDVAQRQIDEVAVQFSILTDPGGEYFSKVATEGLPRIYLLDAQGKIRWFDIEYSEITRENLHRTIEVVLGEN